MYVACDIAAAGVCIGWTFQSGCTWTSNQGCVARVASLWIPGQAVASVARLWGFRRGPGQNPVASSGTVHQDVSGDTAGSLCGDSKRFWQAGTRTRDQIAAHMVHFGERPGQLVERE